MVSPWASQSLPGEKRKRGIGKIVVWGNWGIVAQKKAKKTRLQEGGMGGTLVIGRREPVRAGDRGFNQSSE